MLITSEQFQEFINRHKKELSHILVAESNEKMQNSYVMIDEKMRFLNCLEGDKKPTESILDVGFEKAFKDAGYDQEMFIKRGGLYKWTKDQNAKNEMNFTNMFKKLQCPVKAIYGLQSQKHEDLIEDAIYFFSQIDQKGVIVGQQCKSYQTQEEQLKAAKKFFQIVQHIDFSQEIK